MPVRQALTDGKRILGRHSRAAVNNNHPAAMESLPLRILNHMLYERRKAPRVRVNLRARWEGALHQDTATITDLSRLGCFVLSGGAVQVKELIWLEIRLPKGDPIQLWAEVVDSAREIGFAVKFNSTSPADSERLAKYVDSVLALEAKEKR